MLLPHWWWRRGDSAICSPVGARATLGGSLQAGQLPWVGDSAAAVGCLLSAAAWDAQDRWSGRASKQVLGAGRHSRGPLHVLPCMTYHAASDTQLLRLHMPNFVQQGT